MIDLDSGASIGKVPGSDVNGIAVVSELRRGFISATVPGSVTIEGFPYPVSKLCQNPICLGCLGLLVERKQFPQVI